MQIYCPNFFLVLERNGFSLSSMSVLFLLISNLGADNFDRPLSVSLPFFKVDMLVCAAMDFGPPYWKTLGDMLRHMCLSPSFSS
jgi:hypothetical protein